MWKQAFKAAAGILIITTRADKWSHVRPRLVVLMYHRVLPKEQLADPLVQPGMAVSTETFEKHLQWLRSDRLIALEEWVERLHAGRPLPRRAISLTFDDGWADNYHHAYPLLQRYQVPATIFLTAARIGGAQWFWPERLSRVLMTESLWTTPRDEAELAWITGLLSGERPNGTKAQLTPYLDRAIECAKSRSDQEMEDMLATVETKLAIGPPTPRTLLNWDEVNTMLEGGLVRVGSHTSHHRRVTFPLPQSELWNEVTGSRRLIEQRTGRPCPLFCYPNGDRSSESERLVRDTYAGACTTVRRCNSDREDPFRLARIGVHEKNSDSHAKFRLLLSCLRR